MVNKKAMDQYQQFVEQWEALEIGRTEVVGDHAAIKELVSHLDPEKDAAIETSVTQVACNFREAFAKLVPGGKGELVMQCACGEEVDREIDPGAGAAGGAGCFDAYDGIKIKVSFGQGNTMQMKQLSGG